MDNSSYRKSYNNCGCTPKGKVYCIIVLFILGGIKTNSYNKNTKMKKNIITKYLPKDVETAALFVLKKISTDKSEIIYYPKYYYYLNIVKKIIS